MSADAVQDRLIRLETQLGGLTNAVMEITNRCPKEAEIERAHGRLNDLFAGLTDLSLKHAVTVERQNDLREKLGFQIRYWVTMWMTICSITAAGVKMDVVNQFLALLP